MGRWWQTCWLSSRDIAARVCMEGVVDFYFIGAVGCYIHLPVELAMRTMPSFTGTMPVTEGASIVTALVTGLRLTVKWGHKSRLDAGQGQIYFGNNS